MFRAPPIYAIADQTTFGGQRLAEVAETLAEAGVSWIQIRMKQATGLEAYRWVEACVRRLEGSGAKLWVDDRADVAAMLPVFGVHVGRRDLPPEAVRRALSSWRDQGEGTTGEGLRIGSSTHNLQQLTDADADADVDVVALGPIFETTSKENPDTVVGLENLRRARNQTRKPLVAIGGIGPSNLASVLEAGADSVAMIGALGEASSSRSEIKKKARRLVNVAACFGARSPL